MMRAILIFLSVCGWCINAAAAETAGTVTFVEGVADVLRSDGTSETLRQGSAIGLNERVRTKSYSKVTVALLDQSQLKLAASSCAVVEELELSVSGTRQRCLVFLSRGKAEAVVAKTGAPDTFVVRTPNATGSVKGSDIFVSYQAGNSAMYVKQGALSVVNPAFPEVKRSLVPGTCVFVPAEQPPELPRQAMKSEMALHKRDVEPQLIRKWIPSEDSSVMNAVVTSCSGVVRIHRKTGDDWAAAVSGDELSEGDILQTADDGKAEIRMGNGNAISLAPSTELACVQLRYDDASGAYLNKFEVSEGEVLAVVEKISGESTFEVQTPTAVSGVRGTIMRVVVEPPRSGSPAPAQTQVFFEGGRGVVTSLQNNSVQQLLPGQNVRVDAAGGLSQPQVTSIRERSQMYQSAMKKPQAGPLPGMQGPQQEGLPPKPPMMPPPPGADGKPPLMQPLFINPDIWYKSPMAIHSGTTADISSVVENFKQISLKNNGTWNLIFNGSYATTAGNNWSLHLGNANGDLIIIDHVPVNLSTVPTTGLHWEGMPEYFNGHVNGPEVNRTLTLDKLIVEARPADAQHLTVDARGTYSPL